MSIDEAKEGGGGPAMSPRAFAIAHQRDRGSFVGCSRIADYEVLGKLGEGTFGYVLTVSYEKQSLRLLTLFCPVRFTARGRGKQVP